MSDIFDKNRPQKNIIGFLEDFGLNNTESLIYTALLQTGGGVVNDIAKYTGIKRTTTYSTLDNLIKKGLARYDEFGFKRKIVPEDPRRLELILKEKNSKLEKYMPSLEALFNISGNESTIKYYKGLKAVKLVYESLIEHLKPHDDYFVFSNYELWSKEDPEFFLDFSLRRGRLPINICVILEDNEVGRDYYQMRGALNAKVRFLPKGVSIQTNTVVTPNKILIHQLVNPTVGLVIENKSFISTQLEMFRLVWNSLPDTEK